MLRRCRRCGCSASKGNPSRPPRRLRTQLAIIEQYYTIYFII